MMQALVPLGDTFQSLDQAFGYKNLLQELLLTLVGFSGDVFITSDDGVAPPHVPNPDRCNIWLSTDLDWVDGSDRALIDDLVQLGYHYLAIRGFIHYERSCMVASMARPRNAPASQAHGKAGVMPIDASSATKQTQGSIYRQALAFGLTEALDVYQSAVLALQVQVMEQTFAPVLSALHHQLHDFKVLLPQLHHLIYVVSGSNRPSPPPQSDPHPLVPPPPPTHHSRPSLPSHGPLSGTSILALLADLTRGGLPAMRSTSLRLMWHCNQALHKQLSSWMVYGHLADPYDEFFITRSHFATHIATTGSTRLQDQDQGFDFAHTFEVVSDRLPPGVTSETAEAVAFVGKAVLLLNNPAGEFRGRQLLPHQDTLHAAQVLRELQGSPTFDRVAFECCVTALRSKVAALLWQLVVQQAGLMSHLTAIKDYFLLAKGEFAHAFLMEAHRLLALPPRPQNAGVDVGIPWQQAALKSSAQHDPLFINFRLNWAASGADQTTLPPQARTPTGAIVPEFDKNWDGLWLEAKVDWPLGLLLTPHAMSRYNTLFQLLLRLRRVQLSLERAWVTLCDLSTQVQDDRRAVRAARTGTASIREAVFPYDGVAYVGNDPLLFELQQLRHHMAHLITNLQIYIQVDVIESNFAQLEQRVAAAQDFTEVERAHANYLHTMMAQSFLTTKTMARVVTAVFKHVGELCMLVDATHMQHVVVRAPGGPSRASTGGLTHADAMKQAQTIGAGFQQVMGELYMVLHSSTLLDANKAPHLRQLYLRLDYNNYWRRKFVRNVVS